jgi:hypothetical protein
MASQTHLTPEFIELAPSKLKEGVLYVSMVHSCAIHQCCCGCGEKVVTPLSRGEWQLSYDGETVSLYPSIGNSRFPCGSHYWIRSGKVVWAPKLSAAEAETARLLDRASRNSQNVKQPKPDLKLSTPRKKRGFWYWLLGS